MVKGIVLVRIGSRVANIWISGWFLKWSHNFDSFWPSWRYLLRWVSSFSTYSFCLIYLLAIKAIFVSFTSILMLHSFLFLLILLSLLVVFLIYNVDYIEKLSCDLLIVGSSFSWISPFWGRGLLHLFGILLTVDQRICCPICRTLVDWTMTVIAITAACIMNVESVMLFLGSEKNTCFFRCGVICSSFLQLCKLLLKLCYFCPKEGNLSPFTSLFLLHTHSIFQFDLTLNKYNSNINLFIVYTHQKSEELSKLTNGFQSRHV